MIYSGYTIRKIDCPASLDIKEKEKLVCSLTTIARDAFGTPVTEEDVRNHILPVSTMTLAETEDRLVGFATTSHYCLENFSAIYLVGTCVLREFQGNGVFSGLLEEAIKTESYKVTKPEMFVTRTQSPVLYSGTKKFMGVPNEKSSIALGKQIAHILGGELTDDFVMKGAYGHCMYDSIPRSKYEDDNELFDSLLDYQRGDALLVVGELKKF